MGQIYCRVELGEKNNRDDRNVFIATLQAFLLSLLLFLANMDTPLRFFFFLMTKMDTYFSQDSDNVHSQPPHTPLLAHVDSHIHRVLKISFQYLHFCFVCLFSSISFTISRCLWKGLSALDEEFCSGPLT